MWLQDSLYDSAFGKGKLDEERLVAFSDRSVRTLQEASQPWPGVRLRLAHQEDRESVFLSERVEPSRKEYSGQGGTSPAEADAYSADRRLLCAECPLQEPPPLNLGVDKQDKAAFIAPWLRGP